LRPPGLFQVPAVRCFEYNHSFPSMRNARFLRGR